MNAAPPATARVDQPTVRHALPLPPPAVLRAYALGCLPLFLVYTVANETDGDFSRGFNLLSALWGTLRNAGPGFVLLLALWPYTGWLERRGFGVNALLLHHGLMALLFALSWHLLTYGLIALTRSVAVAEEARARWFIWQSMFGMVMYWAAAGGFTAYRAVLKARAEAAAAAQVQTLLARTELVALRNKLNPHFLFNTLHSIIALTRRDPRRAEDALQIFADLLRHVLDTEKNGEDHVPLQQELDFTRDYLALEALRLGDRLQVQWQVDAAALHLPVPALSIQPLVENSIQHAFNPRSAPGLLTVRVALRQGALEVGVVDDGPGCTPAQWAAGRGLGLKTVSRRLALQHGAAAALRVETAPGQGFGVHFTLTTQPMEGSPA